MEFKVWLESVPRIVIQRNDDASLVVQFPSGARWKYIFPNLFTMQEYLYSYGRNVGRLVSKIKQDKMVKQEELN